MIPRPLLLVLCIGSVQAFLPYSDRMQSRPRLPSWNTRVTSLWDGWKSRYLGSDGLVRGTSAEGDSSWSSRAQADGLLLSLWMGDQPTFDKIWRATEDSLWDAGRGSFRRSRIDSTFRGDAEMDITAALVFASALADSGYWTSTILGGNTYRARAKELIGNDLQGNVLDPSTKLVRSWGGAGNLTWNPSYQSPQWIPILEAFAIENGVFGMDWKSVRRASHALLQAQPASRFGMVRNFSGIAGQAPSAGWGVPTPQDMGLDAIRVPFQLALAIQWHHDSLATAWSDTVWASGGVDATRPGLYSLSGGTGTLWKWCGAQSCGQDAAYQSFLPRSQWGALAVAGSARSSYARAASQRIVADVEAAMTPRTGALVSEWGDIPPLGDPALDGYAQTLGLFGALVMSGRAWNVWGDLRNAPSPRDSFLLERLKATPETLALASTGSAPATRLQARFDRPRRWTLKLVGRSSGAKYAWGDSGEVVDVEWNSRLSSGVLGPKFMAETVDATLGFVGADTLGDARIRATIEVRASTSVLRTGAASGLQVRRQGSGWMVRFAGESRLGEVRLRIRDAHGRTLSREIAVSKSQDEAYLPLESSYSGVLLLEGCPSAGPDGCWRRVLSAP